MIRSRLGCFRKRSVAWLTRRRVEIHSKDGRKIFSRPLRCLCREFSQQETPCIQDDDSQNTNTPQPNSLRLLNKTLYETTTKCQRLGWYARRSMLPSDQNPQMSSTKEYLFRQGNEFEDYVYKHKYGYDPTSTSSTISKANEEGMTIHQSSKLAVVHETSPFEASLITKQLIDNSVTPNGVIEADTVNMHCGIDTILQPTFVCGNNRIVARADVLVRLHNHTVEDTTIIQKQQNDKKENNAKDQGNDNNNALLSNLENLKVVDLKNLCREHGLKVSGTKAVLKHRLREHALPTTQQIPTVGKKENETTEESVAPLHDSQQPWEIVEIKSSTSVRKKIPDLAFTVCVARLAGVNVAKASLVLVDSSYVHSKDNDSKDEERTVYKTIDCTELVEEYIRKKNMGLHIFKLDYVTGNSSSNNNSCNQAGESLGNVCDETADSSSPRPPPQIHYKITCGNCELLGVACGPTISETKEESGEDNNGFRRKPEHGIWELPRLSKKTFPQILKHALPTLELKDLATAVPASLLTKSQARVMQAAATNAVVIDRTKLKEYLLSITTMAHRLDGDDDDDQQQQHSMIRYLDFEAVTTWMPPHPGMLPYESMVTQYSLHSQISSIHNDGDLLHSEYLADPQRDCRRELLERLLVDLGYDLSSPNAATSSSSSSSKSSGPILVYSSYEKTQLSRFSKLFPEHTEAISDIIDHRLVDLEKIIRECVSHPDFCGRTSIKVTLPALCPGFENSYQELSERTGIGEGGAAIAAFVELMSLGSQPADSQTIAATRAALLEYCKLDTLALVELHKALWKLLHKDEEKQDLVSSQAECPLVVKVPNVSNKQQQKIAIADEFLRQVA